MSDIVLLVSPHKDFTAAVAEQVKAELGLACVVAVDFRTAGQAGLVVTTEEVPQALSCPVLRLGKGPFLMLQLLRDIEQMRAQAAEDMVFGEGYVLKIRPKQLMRGQQSVDLTDKEVAVIQCLIGAGGDGESREALLKKVWGIESSLDTHTLETHIYRLRNKIRELGQGDAGDDGLIAATPGGYAIMVK